MLTIFFDPAGIAGRVRAAWDVSKSVQANVERYLKSGGDAEVYLNGERIDPASDPRMDQPPREEDEMRVVMRPAGLDPATWLLIASVALAAVSYSMIPRSPDIAATPKSSPNNSLTGQTNIARAYQAIPDVYGFCRVWPDLIQQSLETYFGNVKFVTEWLCVSRGKGDITEVRYADTPIEDWSGSTWFKYEPAASPSAYPELNTTTLEDVEEPFECPDVDGQELSLADGTLEDIALSFTATIGNPQFTVRFFDEGLAKWEYLKSIAGTGTCFVRFLNYYVGPDYVNELCDVVSFSLPGGPFVEFTFERASNFATIPDVIGTAVQLTPFGGGGVRGPFALPAECDVIQWNVAFLRGLKGAVSIEAQWWKVNAGGFEIGGTRQTSSFSYSADTFDQQFFTSRVTPAAGLGLYKIQFRRTTADLGNGADVAKLEKLYAVRTFDTKSLPGVTVIKLTTKATSQATGTKERRFNLRWQRHVRTLSSSTISASRNFARSLAHLWCVAGENISDLDTAALGVINASIGETSQLLRFDGSIDDADMSLGERMQMVANHARCVVWRDGQLWTVTRDQARPTPELQLDYRNLARNGESAISYAAHLPASHDGVELEYVEEQTQSRKAFVRLNIASGVVVEAACTNPKKINLLGCRTKAQAENRAHLEARKLLYQRQSVTETALAEAASLGIGSTVRWVDPADFGGDEMQAGEVMTISGSNITTSEPLDWKGHTEGRMLFTGVDGLYLGSPVLVTLFGSGATLSSVPAGMFLRDGVTRQLGSRYVFSPGVTSAELEASGLYTVADIKPDEGHNVKISLVNWDSRIYDYDTPRLAAVNGRTGVRASVAARHGSLSAVSARAGARGAANS